jgi:putative RNA 2'-phosphotransferase
MSPLTREQANLSRMLTYMLCHRPDEFGLVLPPDGFVPVKQLLQALSGEPGWGYVRRRHLEELAALEASRWEIEGDRIRARHPGPTALRRPAGEPLPALLYLAIPPRAHLRVHQDGLKPPAGQELLLAATPELAAKLGRRRGATVPVTVRARAAAKASVLFEAYGAGLFLSGAVPREFLQLPPPPREAEKPQAASRPQPVAGALVLDLPQVLQAPAKPISRRALRKWGEKGKKGKRGKG